MNNSFIVWFIDEQGNPVFAQPTNEDSPDWGPEPHWLSKTLSEERLLEADNTGQTCYVGAEVFYNITAVIRY